MSSRRLPIFDIRLLVTAWVACVLAASPLQLQAGDVYQSVYAELTRHDNRLVGSEGYNASVDHLETVLKDAGLETKRQTYGTLAPQTTECRLTVDGTDITSVHALGPGGAVNNTTGGQQLRGPLLWLGNGTLAEMKGKPVEGCIALLRYDSPHMLQVLSQGALAVVFVGSGHETQWQVRSQFIEVDTALPRLFVTEAVARENGWLDGVATRIAEVSVTTTWRDVEGVNLWVEIPAAGAAAEEVVILSAQVGTFGTVPELAPSEREAANCALLAEVAARLAKRPLNRKVCVLFLGSHYFMQDGARMFYYAIRRGRLDELETRAEKYVEATTEARERLVVLQAEDPFALPSSKARTEVVRALESRLAGVVSEWNYDLSKMRVELKNLRGREALMPADEARIETLDAEEEALTTRRKRLNGLRSQLLDGEITDVEGYRGIADKELTWTQREIDDFELLAKHNLTHQEVNSAFGSLNLGGHFAFDFSDATNDWTFSMSGIGAQMFYHTPNAKWAKLSVGDYVKHVRALDAIGEKVMEATGGPSLFDAPTLSLQDPTRFCVPAKRSVPIRVAHAMQSFGYQMVTVGDALNRDELPYRGDVDLDPLCEPMAAFCEQLATDASLSQTCPLAEPKWDTDSVIHFRGEGGYRYLHFARGSEEVAGVPDDAIGLMNPKMEGPMLLAGHSYSSASRILATGHIFMPICYKHVKMRPLGFDEMGSPTLFPSEGNWKPRRLFYGFGGLIQAPIQPGPFGPFSVTMAGGESDSLLKGYTQGGKGAWKVFYADEDTTVKMFSKSGMLVLGSSDQFPQGRGIELTGRPLYTFNPLRQCALDYLKLNESRLQILRERAIVNDSLESLHADAGEHWEEAVAARAADDVPVAVAHEAFAAALGARVAGPLREVTNDMVRAVVLLLALVLPFAFVMERLFISATSIYRQVLGFVGFFIGSFALLYMVHPAFAIASAPMVIFLAFVIILLSGLVISIVMSKFKKELRAIQGLSTSAHGVSSDSSTAMAAVLIGISGMRNRPLKTFLTALTIILLTFAIVVFASITPRIGVTETYRGKGEGHNRIELHRFSSLEIPSMLHESLQGLYADGWDTYAREAIFRDPGSQVDGELVVYNAANRKWETMMAMLAIDPAELAYSAPLAKAIPAMDGLQRKPGDLPPIYLSSGTARELELTVGDRVTVGGKPFAFGGTFEPAILEQMEFMDGSKITPPDFESSANEISDDGSGGGSLTVDEVIDTSRFTYTSARQTAITLPGELRELEREEMRVHMNAITLYAKGEVDVEATAAELSKLFEGPVFAKGARGANEFYFSKSMQASGFSVVIVPLLLGGLIIFNSLLGSIVERQKEIFTYSAMGLAPPDVGALFFAESSVYAILGGMGGYLVSQIAAKFVSFCGEMGWFVPPEMNFSSFTSVLTIFIVMAMVIISTIYPAIKAGKSANPGVARKWKMPPPKDAKIEFVFPFTVSAEDMGGILVFISEHFENHGDASIGSFAANEVALYVADEKRDDLGIRANISLAPFDLGVMQAFSMYARPSEIEGIDEVVVHLEKISGTEGAWLRGNRVFVDDLREQFLLWRSLPVTTVAHYRERSEGITV